MSVETYPPQKLATVELLTQEIAFANPEKLVAEINRYHQKNTKYDAEYYESVGTPPKGQKEVLLKVMSILDRNLQLVASMEFHALVRAPSEEDAIPRIGDAILFRHHLLNALEVVKEVIKHKHSLTDPDQQCYLEHFIQRWIYKFCRHIFHWEDLETQLLALFAQEQKKGKDGFQNFILIFTHLTDLHQAPNSAESGYNPINMRRFYVIFSNLLLLYLKQSISLPFNLQRIFVEFHKNNFFRYDDFNKEDEPTQAEKKALLIAPGAVKPFFLQLKSINNLMKRAVLFGMMIDPERKFAIGYFCDLGIKGVADMYKFIDNKLKSGELSEAQGNNWLHKVYQTITEVVEEKGIVENTEIPAEIREIFGSAKTFALPLFEEDNPEEEEAPPAPKIKDTSPGPKIKDISPASEIMDIPNLVEANNLEELQDKGRAKKIVIVQDANVLDLIVQNWEIRGSLTFPELIEFARIPFQVFQSKGMGLREGRKFVSFAYLIALGMEEDHIKEFVEKLARAGQISEERASQLHRLYPLAVEQIGNLTRLDIDPRPVVSTQGMINTNVFIEKCEALQKAFMQHYSYIQSLLGYWIIVEEMFYSIARSTAVMGNIVDPTPEKIEAFVSSKNNDYMVIYEKALTFAGPLKTHFKKKYNPELQKQFVNVKIKNDLIAFTKITPIDLAKREG